MASVVSVQLLSSNSTESGGRSCRFERGQACADPLRFIPDRDGDDGRRACPMKCDD